MITKEAFRVQRFCSVRPGNLSLLYRLTVPGSKVWGAVQEAVRGRNTGFGGMGKFADM